MKLDDLQELVLLLEDYERAMGLTHREVLRTHWAIEDDYPHELANVMKMNVRSRHLIAKIRIMASRMLREEELVI